MRFSDSFLRQLKERASIATYAERLVQFDRRKSQPSRGDYWAPCPFHNEKTASFHVRDRVGSYKCFGCGESGGVLDLAMKLEGLSFPEAVERVANFAGLALPADDGPRDDAEDQRRRRLLVVMERAGALYAAALEAPEGREAKSYLERRGLNAAVRAQFGVGYAPGGYTWTIDKLRAEGVSMDEIVACGLAYPGEDGRRPADLFRNRIMFPITDPQGRVIAFGGRAMDPNDQAKYKNSPETALYQKSRVLYRLKEARALQAKSKAKGLILGEGYMDVIAFERAGLGAVAPCGTALTDDQLALLWRAGGEPVLCFDGDEAGRRAAGRAIDLALPQFGPDKTLRIAALPIGEDPDDVFRKAGPKALADLIAAARPAVDVLFERERDAHPLDTPEEKSSLRKRLRYAAARITDGDTQRLYREELMARADALLARPSPQQRGPAQPYTGKRGERWTPPITARPETKARSQPGQRTLRQEALLREAIDFPVLIEAHTELLASLPLGDSDLERIRDSAIGLFIAGGTVDRTALSLHLSNLGEVRAMARLSHWPTPWETVRNAQDSSAVEAEWVAAAEWEAAVPLVRDELEALRGADLDADDDAFARAVRVLEDVREADRRRTSDDAQDEEDAA